MVFLMSLALVSSLPGTFGAGLRWEVARLPAQGRQPGREDGLDVKGLETRFGMSKGVSR